VGRYINVADIVLTNVVRLNQLMVFLGPGLGTGKTCGEIKPVNGIS
jgi:hypothetical protein